MQVQLKLGDCILKMFDVDDEQIDAIISDPPYELTSTNKSKPDGGINVGPKGFMGKVWDGTGIAFAPQLWNELYRILRPGGIVKAFGGSRTFHRMAVAMEDAGFVDIHLEAWIYASGFPKSMDVSKAIDKMKGAVREPKRIPFKGNALMRHGGDNTRPWIEAALAKGYHELPGSEPSTPEAKLWNGWGTALKPAWEPILFGRKE